MNLLALPDFLESANSLDKNCKAKLVKTLSVLGKDIRHPSLQCKKVQGASAAVYECRVDLRTRLIYDVDSGALRLWYVGEHDPALRYARARTVPESVAFDDISFGEPIFGLASVRRFLDEGVAPSSFEVFLPSAVE